MTTSIIEYTIKLQILDDRGYERRQDPHIKEGWHGERKIPHADRADVLDVYKRQRILVGGDGHSGLLVLFNIPDDVPAVSLILTADDLDMGDIHRDPAFPADDQGLLDGFLQLVSFPADMGLSLIHI